jgi:hypothetical protein
MFRLVTRCSPYKPVLAPLLRTHAVNGTANLQLLFQQNGSGQYVVANADKFGYAPIKLGRRVMEFSLKYSF